MAGSLTSSPSEDSRDSRVVRAQHKTHETNRGAAVEAALQGDENVCPNVPYFRRYQADPRERERASLGQVTRNFGMTTKSQTETWMLLQLSTVGAFMPHVHVRVPEQFFRKCPRPGDHAGHCRCILPGEWRWPVSS